MSTFSGSASHGATSHGVAPHAAGLHAAGLHDAFTPAPSGAGAPGARARLSEAYPATDSRLAPICTDLARRLRPALAAAGVVYPAPEFDALVLEMARVALRWSTEEVRRREGDAPERLDAG